MISMGVAGIGLTGIGLAGDEEAKQTDGIQNLLEAIDVGPYEVPALSLRKDHNYGASAVDVEPFRHVTPFKEHFLEQMEYTGPGRAIPEPERVDGVRVGFIGPIMATVSVAGSSSNSPAAMPRGPCGPR